MTRFLLTVALLLPTLAHAQQGRVEYTVVTEIDVQLPPEIEAMRDRIPSQTTAHLVLLFDADGALTQRVQKDESVPDPSLPSDDDGNVSVVMMTGGGDAATYVDRASGAVVQTRDLFGRPFRILRQAPTLRWRLTGEQSEFLGYACQRATAEHDGATVEAWFTTEVPASVGPEMYGGLPGLILVLRVGSRTFEATSLDLSPLADGAVAPPTGGREVTAEQLQEIQAERMRDLETMGLPGRRGSVQILGR